MEDNGLIQVQIPIDLYRQIDQWRIELSQTYNLREMEMDTFIAILLLRSHVDVSIMLWELTEGLHAFKDIKRNNEN